MLYRGFGRKILRLEEGEGDRMNDDRVVEIAVFILAVAVVVWLIVTAMIALVS